MNELKVLKENIRMLRSQRMTLDSFQQAMLRLEEPLSPSLSRGLLLKLKNGNMTKVLEVSKRILDVCSACNNVHKEKEFDTRLEQLHCADLVEKALADKKMSLIKRPNWYEPVDNQIGAERYCQCEFCGSIWCLVEPERQYNGLWERIA